MANENGTGTPDGGTVTTTNPGTPGASDGATTTTAPDGAEQLRNPAGVSKELKTLREGNQKLEQKLDALVTQFTSAIQALKPAEKPPEKPKDQPQTTPADVAVAELRQELAYKDALTGLDKPLTREQRGILDRLFKAEKPSPEALNDWIGKNVAALGVTAAPSIAQAATPAAPKVDAGPAGTPSQEVLPVNVFKMSRSQIQGLSNEEFRKRLTEYKANNGGRKKHLFD